MLVQHPSPRWPLPRCRRCYKGLVSQRSTQEELQVDEQSHARTYDDLVDEPGRSRRRRERQHSARLAAEGFIHMPHKVEILDSERYCECDIPDVWVRAGSQGNHYCCGACGRTVLGMEARGIA